MKAACSHAALSLTLLLTACDGGKATVQLYEVDSEENLQGLTVSTDTDEGTTDGRGTAKVQIPENGGFVIRVEDPAGERPAHEILQNGWGGEYYIGHGIVTNAEIDRIAGGLGTTIDASKGILEVSVTWLEDNGALTEMYGATVDIDADYDIAVVQDEASEVGWSLGNVPPATGGYAVVAFGNVAPGDVKVTVTPTEAVGTCGSWPSEDEDSWGEAVPVKAGQVSSYTLLCTRGADARVATTDAAAASQPWSRLGILHHVQDAGTTADTLRRQGEVRIPSAGGAAPTARYELSAQPASAPTHVTLTVSSDGADLTVGLDTEQARVSLTLDGAPITLNHFADGTFAVDNTVYPGFQGLLHHLTTDARLAPLTDVVYVAWLTALSEVRAAAPTRFTYQGAISDVGSLTAEPLPGRLGCARLGADSASCRLWSALSGSPRVR